MRHVSRSLALAVVATLLPAWIAGAQPMPRPNTVRLDGYVGPPPERRHDVADLHLRAAGTDVRFQVTNARIMAGRGSTNAMFAELRPRRPNLTLRGESALIDRVATAAPGARLRLLGNWRRGSRDFFLSSVEPLPAVGPTPGANGPQMQEDQGVSP